MSVSVYSHMVGAFRVSSVYAVASIPACSIPFGTKKKIMNIPALENQDDNTFGFNGNRFRREKNT